MLFRSNDTATTEIYTPTITLSLHDALPIFLVARASSDEQEQLGTGNLDSGCGLRPTYLSQDVLFVTAERAKRILLEAGHEVGS